MENDTKTPPVAAAIGASCPEPHLLLQRAGAAPNFLLVRASTPPEQLREWDEKNGYRQTAPCNDQRANAHVLFCRDGSGSVSLAPGGVQRPPADSPGLGGRLNTPWWCGCEFVTWEAGECRALSGGPLEEVSPTLNVTKDILVGFIPMFDGDGLGADPPIKGLALVLGHPKAEEGAEGGPAPAPAPTGAGRRKPGQTLRASRAPSTRGQG